MTRSDRELASDALEHLQRLREHAGRGDLSDETVADAVALRLSAAIEVLAGSKELRDRVFGADWPAAWSTRNRIAHSYSSIDAQVIAETVARDVPALERRLREVLGLSDSPQA